MNHIHHHHDDTPLDKHEGHRTADFLTKFWICLALTVPIIAYSDLPHLFFGWQMPSFSGSNYFSALLGSIIYFYGGGVFLRGALSELKARLPGMMTLISLAITTAYVYSIWSVVQGSGMSLFWELSTLIVIMLLGHWIEMKAVQSAQGALHELARLIPDSADVIKDGTPHSVPISELESGMIVLVRPGGKIPVDGVVTQGSSEVNESILTGESRPVSKSEGATVIAGSINGDGSLQIRIEKTGEATFLAGIMKLVSDAETSKSKLQLLSDKAAYYLTILALFAGAVTYGSWIYVGEPAAFAMERVVAVLVIACPHALGLAIPLVASISTTIAARNGFFIKRRLALESARNITTVVFDKTGTLTQGAFGVVDIIGHELEVLKLAAAANAMSEHPIAKAIVAHAQRTKMEIPQANSFVRLPGKGVQAEVESAEILVGSSDILSNVVLTDETIARVRQYESEGKTVVHVVRNQMYEGSISLADVIRTESKEAIKALKSMNIRVAMITGDAHDVAAWVAREVGVDEFFAHISPDKKASIVKDLQVRGEKVAMVGDGVNDAPALTQADVGIAVGAGTNVAIESAGIILVRNDPRDIASIVRLSRRTYAKMVQNLFWATGYNIVALPVAAGALYAYGIMLDPAVAAVFMSLSTVIVAANARTLKQPLS